MELFNLCRGVIQLVPWGYSTCAIGLFNLCRGVIQVCSKHVRKCDSYCSLPVLSQSFACIYRVQAHSVIMLLSMNNSSREHFVCVWIRPCCGVVHVIAFCLRVLTWVCVQNRPSFVVVYAVAFCLRVSTWACVRNRPSFFVVHWIACWVSKTMPSVSGYRLSAYVWNRPCCVVVHVIAFCLRVSTCVCVCLKQTQFCVWNRLSCGVVHVITLCLGVSTWCLSLLCLTHCFLPLDINLSMCRKQTLWWCCPYDCLLSQGMNLIFERVSETLYCGVVHAIAFCLRVSTWAVARNSGWVWLEQSTVMPTSIFLMTRWARWTPMWENTSSRRWLEPGGFSDTRSASLSVGLQVELGIAGCWGPDYMPECLSVGLQVELGIAGCWRPDYMPECLSVCLQVELGIAGCWRPDYMPECLSVCKGTWVLQDAEGPIICLICCGESIPKWHMHVHILRTCMHTYKPHM